MTKILVWMALLLVGLILFLAGIAQVNAQFQPLWVPTGNATGGLFDIQTFTGAPGTYTWTKPDGAHSVLVFIIGPGGGGGSGGYNSSDSGGGGGASGLLVYQVFDASQLNATEDVILIAGATGGARKAVDGNGNDGGNAGETSFGAAARNLIRIDPTATISGTGGGPASGPGGSNVQTNYTTIIGLFSGASQNGGAGDDAIAGTNGSVAGVSTVPMFIYVGAGSAGGGGGTNAGAGFTAGGNGGGQINLSTKSTLRANPTAGTLIGQDGSNGEDGGYLLTTAGGDMYIYGGTGGGGGAGSNTGNGGNGGSGGKCGGGGGGGGSSLNGAQGSGAGGNGGQSCVFVITW